MLAYFLRYLLRNIKRKNTETSMLGNEKSRLGMELVRTKQDIATIINENLLLKKVNNDHLSTIANLESKVTDLSLQNQAIWAQIVNYK